MLLCNSYLIGFDWLREEVSVALDIHTYVPISQV